MISPQPFLSGCDALAQQRKPFLEFSLFEINLGDAGQEVWPVPRVRGGRGLDEAQSLIEQLVGLCVLPRMEERLSLLVSVLRLFRAQTEIWPEKLIQLFRLAVQIHRWAHTVQTKKAETQKPPALS